MGLEANRIRDQIAGQLQGTEEALKVAERELREAEERVSALAASCVELRAILEAHEKAVLH